MNTVLIYTGSYSLSRIIASFCTQNNALLRQYGFLYPLQFGFDDLGAYHHSVLSYAARNIIEFPDLKSSLCEPAGSFPGKISSYETLCFCCPHFSTDPTTLRNIINLCATIFPKATIKIFHTFARHDLELMACLYFFSLRFYQPIHALTHHKSLSALQALYYDDLWEVLESAVGQKNFYPFIDTHTKDTFNQVQAAFLKAACLPKNDLAIAGADFTTTEGYFPLSPEQAAFIRAVNSAVPPQLLKLLNHPLWGSQKGLEAQSLGKRRPCFSPQYRAFLETEQKKSCIALAARLGHKSLFPSVESDSPYEPYTGLSIEEAVSITKALEPGFAAQRLAEMEQVPEHYLDWNARIAKRALHSALRSSSSLVDIFPPVQPKLTVLTLTYNHAKYIEDAIKGVIAQKTNFPIAHIIADDSSDDGTQEIILRYAKQYPHIIPVFQQARSKGTGNVAALFGMARSPYIALCDGDDYFTDPSKLQMQADFLDAHPDCALCFHPVRVTYEDDPTNERFYPPLKELPRGVRQFYYLSDLIKCNLIQTNSVMYRWRFTDGLPDWFQADLMPGDWYWHLLHAELGKIGFINKVMSVYRRHTNSLYYLAEVDRLKHRYTVGLKELQAFDVVNKHFNRKFESILLDLTNGVFADCLLYAEKTDDMSIIEELVEKYPHFGQHFLSSLKIVSGKRP